MMRTVGRTDSVRPPFFTFSGDAMKHAIVACGIVMLGICSMLLGQTESRLELAAMKEAPIVLPADAIASEKYAAEEFQRLWKMVAGQDLAISTSPASGPCIWIGPNAAAAVPVRTDDLGEEGLRISIAPNGIAIAGGRPRGTLYGVYEFFEKYFGVRFLTHDHTHAPPAAFTALTCGQHAFTPVFESLFSSFAETRRNKEFSVRMRCNQVATEAQYGGICKNRTNSHSFFRQIPSKTYGKEHPEYYGLVDGERRWNVDGKDAMPILGNQPCLTNPDVLRIVTESVLEQIEKYPDIPNVSVSTNDNFHYCRCPACAAIDEREQSNAATLLAFVNAIADEVAKKHPDKKIGTLIYQYTRKPPKTIMPHPNVQLQLCTIECSQVRPLTDPDVDINVAFCEDLKEWGRRSKDIRIWTYNTNFYNYLLPCPNLWNIEPNLRLFAASSVRGIYMQAAGNTIGSSMSDLRNYVTSRLLWNPQLSGQELIDEFLNLHYGPAAPPIRRFVNLVHDNAVKRGCTKNCFATGADYGIDDEIALAALAAFSEAMQLADSDEVRLRVEKASICAYRAAVEDVWQWIYDVPNERPNKHDEPMPAHTILKTRPYAAILFRLCEKYGVTMWDELVKIETARDYFRKAYRLSDNEPL